MIQKAKPIACRQIKDVWACMNRATRNAQNRAGLLFRNLGFGKGGR
ncbi:hypothetical protein [Actinomadura rupiterrae]|nr:hypothetical protein [Actinomadura rupiterrae]MCP2343642.1 hypothetical protein [Actinomadura rupiterrae]